VPFKKGEGDNTKPLSSLFSSPFSLRIQTQSIEFHKIVGCVPRTHHLTARSAITPYKIIKNKCLCIQKSIHDHLNQIFIRLRRKPRLRAETPGIHFGVQARPWLWRNVLMRDISFQRSMYPASADFAHRRMMHRNLGLGGYGFWGPRACPWGSIF